MMDDCTIIPVDKLDAMPYSSILCFPKPSESELRNRIDELKGHGVEALEFTGNSSIFGAPLRILGKGFVGVVVVARFKGKRIAVKIRRVDADRTDLFHEAKMLSKANSTSLAPKVFAVSRNFLLMQLIEGDLLPGWLAVNKEMEIVRRVLASLLNSCYHLDEIGLDHGELSNASKHVIVDSEKKPWIVDFETASECRKTSNLSSVCSFLFINESEIVRDVASVLGERNKADIIEALQAYKKTGTKECFNQILKACLY
jgi:putative serine/threonine protein kinase